MRRADRRHAPSPIDGETGRPNSLGLSRGRLESLLDRVERSPESFNGARKRRFVRWPFRHETLDLTIAHPGGSVANVTVACRNLSHGGASILHSAFLYPGSECTVILPHPTKGPTPTHGTIVRCVHLHKMVHEIGLKFDELIDARQYVPLSTRNGRFAVEMLEPGDIAGRLVAVDPNPPDLKVLDELLAGTNASLVVAESAEAALPLLERECDMLLCADELPGMSPAELIERYRKIQQGAPVVLMTPAESRPLVQPPPGVSAMLAKPIGKDDLFRCVGEFLLLGGEERARAATGPRHEAILETFCRDIRELAPRIEKAYADQDAMGCYVLSQQVLGAAPQVGLRTLTRLADAASETLAITMSLERSKQEVEALIEACRHVAARATD